MKILIVLVGILGINLAHARFTDLDLQTLIKESAAKDSDALIVWKDGKVLHSFDKNSANRYSIQSVTKSLASLTTACILKNEPDTLDAAPAFKEWMGTSKNDISLRMLLQMSSGIQDPMDFWKHKEYYDYSLELPLVTTPGNRFAYANSSTMLVGRWIKEKTGKTFTQNLQKCFLKDLDISEFIISTDAQGNEVASGGLYLKSYDLLKFGIMLAQQGKYNGKELLTSNQVYQLRSDYLRDGNGYGQGFWTWGKKIYYGEGFLGQWLIIVPSQNLVIVRLRNPVNMQWSVDDDLKWWHELPALIQSLI